MSKGRSAIFFVYLCKKKQSLALDRSKLPVQI